MSNVETTSTWLERTSDWLNPILVKEARQALKSRQFVTTFMVLLVLAWLVTVFGMLTAGSALEFGSVGRQFFLAYYFVLAVAAYVAVPFVTYRTLLSERELDTYELLSITTLTPRQIVWGKLLCSLLQLFIFYSAIAPFIAFTSLLQGFDMAQVLFLLTLGMLISLMASMTALMVSTLARQKHWQALASLGVFSGLIWLLVWNFVFSTALMAQGLSLQDPDFWWGMGVVLLVFGSYFVLFHQIAASRLTFESDNRSTGIRLICSGQFWMLWIIFFATNAFVAYRGVAGTFTLDRFGFNSLVLVCAAHWFIVGLFAITERDALSRRIRRGIPHAAGKRTLFAPFLPGGARGYLYLLLHLAALWLIAGGLSRYIGGYPSSATVWEHARAIAAHLFVDSWGQDIQFLTAVCGYLVFYLGIACALGRWGHDLSADIRPAHIRVFMLVIVAVGVIAPLIPSVTSTSLASTWSTYPLLSISDPITTLMEISSSRTHAFSLTLAVVLGAMFMLLVNATAMWRGVTELEPVQSAAPADEPATETELAQAGA